MVIHSLTYAWVSYNWPQNLRCFGCASKIESRYESEYTQTSLIFVRENQNQCHLLLYKIQWCNGTKFKASSLHQYHWIYYYIYRATIEQETDLSWQEPMMRNCNLKGLQLCSPGKTITIIRYLIDIKINTSLDKLFTNTCSCFLGLPNVQNMKLESQ